MSLLLNNKLYEKLKTSYVVLDTGIFIKALKNEEIKDFLFKLKKSGCSFFTIPSVYWEFIRVSNSLEDFKKQSEFFFALVDYIYPIEKEIDNYGDFMMVSSKINSSMPYTDFLLAVLLYHHKESKCYLFSSDLKDFRREIFDRSIITWYDDNEVENLALFRLNKRKYQKAASNIIKESEADIPF